MLGVATDMHDLVLKASHCIFSFVELTPDHNKWVGVGKHYLG